MESALYIFKQRRLVGPGWLLDRCEGLSMPVHMAVLGPGVELPMGIQCRGVVVVGLPLPHATLDRKDPAIREQQIFVRTLIGLAVPYLGIGYGAQLLASAMLGQVREQMHDDVGAGEMVLTQEAALDALLGGGDARVPVVRWPAPGLELPAKAVLLAGTDARPDAFRLGECAWGLLPHLEVTPQGFGDWLADAALTGANPEGLVAEVEAQQSAQQELAYRLMDRFLGRVQGFCHDEPPLVQLGDHPPGLPE